MIVVDRNELAAQQIQHYERGDGASAVAIARLSVTDPIIPDNLSFNSSSLLINFGEDQQDESLIVLGMQIAHGFLDSHMASEESVSRARYNLSNGYAALALDCERKGDLAGRLEWWQKQRDELQTLVLEPATIPEDLKTEVFTNFGNVLDELGRSVEALDMFRRALSLNSKHPIASGSTGQLLLRLLGIQPIHNVRLLAAAKEHLELALSDAAAIRRHSSDRAVESYAKSLESCSNIARALFGGCVDKFSDYITELKTMHKEWNAPGPLGVWAKEGLVLTVNPNPEWCPATLKDDLYFDGLSTSADQAGQDRFDILAHTLNQIKEDFAQARYLLDLSKRPGSYQSVSSATQFADTLDYADFGLASGMLKSSIRISVDAFDKIANFMNRYFELGLPERNVSFASVWYEKGILNPKTRVDHPVLAAQLKSSVWMRGIQDVARNLNQYPAPSKDVRNKATHDYLIIENLSKPVVKLHGKSVRVDAREYARQLLLMLKGAIVNLIACVQREEGLKKESSSKLSLPMEFRFATGISDELAGSGEGVSLAEVERDC